MLGGSFMLENYNLYPILEQVRASDFMTEDLFKEILEAYGLTLDDFVSGEGDKIAFSKLMFNRLFKKENKNFHTITSRDNFNHLTDESDDTTFLLYEPLNNHSRPYLQVGDILFSYRSGQFGSLGQALKQRGIYGLGIALSNPLKISDEHTGNNDYKNYGIIVFYPFKLKEHLSVRDIQLNPSTIDLTPYNGNRNDSLQHIPKKKHYESLLGMILYKNPFLTEAFSFLNLDVKEQKIPDDMWHESEDEAYQVTVKKGKSEEKADILGINRIYFGAPGTGKSYAIQQFIKEHGIAYYHNKVDCPNVFRITLHPEFSYTDFIGQVMPVVTPMAEGSDQTRIEYTFKPQIFTKALKFAFDHNKEPVFLILEEMSRANVAAVFGDIFQLLDRDEDGESEYRIDNDLIANEVFKDPSRKVYLPNNLFILGTVNANDQNVFVMDTAFKRRFEFEYMDAQRVVTDDTGKPLNNFKFQFAENISFDWVTLYQTLNKFITNQQDEGLGLDEDKQVGQFFIKFRKNDESYNYNQFSGKLLEYLWNDVQKATYSDVSLFKREFASFSQIYQAVRKKENIFSNQLLEQVQLTKQKMEDEL